MIGRELTQTGLRIEHPGTDRARTNRRFEIGLSAMSKPKNLHGRIAVTVISEREIRSAIFR